MALTNSHVVNGASRIGVVLVADEIGVSSPLTILRHTEKLELRVTPEEQTPGIRQN